MTLPLAGRQIVITRPMAQAQRLSQAIIAAGGQPIFFPLIEIVGLPDLSAFQRSITPLSQFDWIIFISSNAVQYAMPSLLQQGIPPSLSFAAIGPVTAQALHAHGVAEVVTPHDRYDSEALLALPVMQAMQGKRVCIVRGVGGRELLGETLKQRGASVVFAECYRRICPQDNAIPLAQAAAHSPLAAMVITSTEALQSLLQLQAKAPWLADIPLCVNHARIAEQAQSAGLRATVAAQPGDEAMMQLLINSCAPFSA